MRPTLPWHNAATWTSCRGVVNSARSCDNRRHPSCGCMMCWVGGGGRSSRRGNSPTVWSSASGWNANWRGKRPKNFGLSTRNWRPILRTWATRMPRFNWSGCVWLQRRMLKRHLIMGSVAQVPIVPLKSLGCETCNASCERCWIASIGWQTLSRPTFLRPIRSFLGPPWSGSPISTGRRVLKVPWTRNAAWPSGNSNSDKSNSCATWRRAPWPGYFTTSGYWNPTRSRWIWNGYDKPSKCSCVC